MTKRIPIVLALLITGCAGASLQKEWEDQRGYSKDDSAAIMAQYQVYKRDHIGGSYSSNRFNSAPRLEVESRFKAIFCGCAKKLGERCRQKPDGLAGADRELWVKANAVDMVYASEHTSFDAAPIRKIDTAECGS